MAAENSALPSQEYIKLKYINISQYYSFYSTFDYVNAALVTLKKKH